MKKITMLAALLLTAALMAGCGESSEKAITNSGSDGSSENTGSDINDQSGGGETGTQEVSNGYVLIVKDTVISIDFDISVVTDALGEPLSYYEAESCAFDGLDKIYTFAGFTAQTYPDSDKIYMIVLKDDSVETQEGVCIGSTLDDVLEAYGEDYTEETGSIVYYKDTMRLSFIIQSGTVASIEYTSTAYD